MNAARSITTKLLPCSQCRLYSSYARNSIGRYPSRDDSRRPERSNRDNSFGNQRNDRDNRDNWDNRGRSFGSNRDDRGNSFGNNRSSSFGDHRNRSFGNRNDSFGNNRYNHNDGDDMESEHDNFRTQNKDKQKQKYGNIRNFKPATGEEPLPPRQSSPNSKSQYVYGRACVYAALTAKRRKPYKLFISDNFNQQGDGEEDVANSPEGSKSYTAQDCIALAQANRIPVVPSHKNHLSSLSGDRPHQGVVLEASEIHYEPITNLESPDSEGPTKLKNKQFPLWVALDQIWDPQNFGAIIRSCYFFGVSGLVITEHNSPLTATASRASAGALEVFPIYYQKYLNKFIGESKKLGWHVIGASISSSKDIPTISAREMKLDKPTILVLGNESFGLREKIASMCDAIVNIHGQPDLQIVDSLNVSVATGVLLHSLTSNQKTETKNKK